MMGLIVAENQRLLGRRITRFFPLGVAALMIVGIVIAYFNQGPDGVDFVNDIATGANGGGPDDDSTLVLGPMGFLMPIMGFVIGASYFGADQKAGMIEQLLTWEPRRSRLLIGRVLGGMVSLFVITALLSAFLVLLLYLLSSFGGSTEGAGDIWLTVLGAIIRSGIVGALFFALGLAVTVIVNSSVGAIVGFLIYAFVVNPLLQGFLPKVSRYLPMENADSFVIRTGVGDGGFFGDGGLPGQIRDFDHGWIAAGLFVALWACAVYGLALVIFARRDID